MGRPRSWTEEDGERVMRLLSQGMTVRGVARVTGLSKSAVQRVRESYVACGDIQHERGQDTNVPPDNTGTGYNSTSAEGSSNRPENISVLSCSDEGMG